MLTWLVSLVSLLSRVMLLLRKTRLMQPLPVATGVRLLRRQPVLLLEGILLLVCRFAQLAISPDGWHEIRQRQIRRAIVLLELRAMAAKETPSTLSGTPATVAFVAKKNQGGFVPEAFTDIDSHVKRSTPPFDSLIR